MLLYEQLMYKVCLFYFLKYALKIDKYKVMKNVIVYNGF